MGMHDAFTKVADNLSAILGIVSTNAWDSALDDSPERQHDPGYGGQIVAKLKVTEAYSNAGGGDGTLVTPVLVASNEPGLGGGSVLYLATLGGAIPFQGLGLADLTLGAEYILAIPSRTVFDYTIPSKPVPLPFERRYYGFAFFIASGATGFTAGRWTVSFEAYKGPMVPRRHTIGYAGP